MSAPKKPVPDASKATGNAGATTATVKPDPRVEDPYEKKPGSRPEQADPVEIAPDAIPDEPPAKRS